MDNITTLRADYDAACDLFKEAWMASERNPLSSALRAEAVAAEELKRHAFFAVRRAVFARNAVQHFVEYATPRAS